jgi:hypothetical protein
MLPHAIMTHVSMLGIWLYPDFFTLLVSDELWSHSVSVYCSGDWPSEQCRTRGYQALFGSLLQL